MNKALRAILVWRAVYILLLFKLHRHDIRASPGPPSSLNTIAHQLNSTPRNETAASQLSKSLPFPLTSSIQHRSRILQQIRLSQVILRIPRIILQNTLDRIIRLHINGQRLCADDPRNALAARRSGERTRVLVDAVRVKVVDQP